MALAFGLPETQKHEKNTSVQADALLDLHQGGHQEREHLNYHQGSIAMGRQPPRFRQPAGIPRQNQGN
jgi:hypothetical protein